jgi:protein-disulfide isomerase
MASGKASKAKRRAAAAAPPPVRSKGAPRTRSASPRVLIIAGIVVAAVAVAIVLGVVLTRGSSNNASSNVPAVGSLANGLPGASDVAAMYRGIPQSDVTLGRSSAPATLTEFVDLQCPYCQQFETQTLPTIVDKYVRAGKLKIVMRPWAFIGPDSIRGQAAVLAAAQQNKGFNLASVLYANQGTENTGWLDDRMVTAAAASVPGLRVPELLTARKSSAVSNAAKFVDGQASDNHVDSTPTLFVGKSGTPGTVVKLSSPTDSASLERAIQKALAQAS